MSSRELTVRLNKIGIKTLIYLLLILFSIYFLIPIYVMLVTGLKSFQEVNLKDMWSLPSRLSLDGFKKAAVKLYPNLRNSFLLAIPATMVSALLGSLNGYVFSKWRFKGFDLLFVFVLFGMFIPYQSILIPIVRVLQWISIYTRPLYDATAGLAVPDMVAGFPLWLAEFIPGYGTIGGLILIHVIYGIPIATLVFRNYYAGIPTDLLEAGMIDGAGLLGLYRWILFPISMPAFVVVLIWQFTSIWNDFLFGVIVTSNPSVQPVTVALNNLAGSYIVEWNVQMAGSLIAALPTVLIFIFLSRYFIRGLMAGSLKG